MINEKEGLITLVDEKNNVIKVQVVFVFEIESLNKKYVVYTFEADKPLDDIKIYISEVDKNTNEIKEIPESEKDFVLENYKKIIDNFIEEN